MKVSVVMPVHNGARFLDESIRSIVADGFDELVIVDDGSTDETPALLEAWAAREPRILVVTLARNRGLAHALNHGLETARGEYVARHDADEVYVRGRIAAQVELLDRERDVVLVSTWFDIIDEQGRRTGTYRPGYSPEEVHYLLNFYNVLGGHAQVMFRREAVLCAGRYAEEFSTVEDYDLWRRLRRLGRIAILPRIGLLRRHHSSGVSFAQHKHQRALSGQVMRLALGDTLGRAVSDEEAKAIATLWRGEYHPGLAGIAVQLSREAGDMRRVLRRRVLFATARALKRGYVRDALQWLSTVLRTARSL